MINLPPLILNVFELLERKPAPELVRTYNTDGLIKHLRNRRAAFKSIIKNEEEFERGTTLGAEKSLLGGTVLQKIHDHIKLINNAREAAHKLLQNYKKIGAYDEGGKLGKLKEFNENVLGRLFGAGIISPHEAPGKIPLDVRTLDSRGPEFEKAVGKIDELLKKSEYEPYLVYALQGECLKYDDYISHIWNEKLDNLLGDKKGEFGALKNIVNFLPLLYKSSDATIFSDINTELDRATEDLRGDINKRTQILTGLRAKIEGILDKRVILEDADIRKKFRGIEGLPAQFEKYSVDYKSMDEKDPGYISTFGREAVVLGMETKDDLLPGYQARRSKRRRAGINKTKFAEDPAISAPEINDTQLNYDVLLNLVQSKITNRKGEDLPDIAEARLVSSHIAYLDKQMRAYWGRLLAKVDDKLEKDADPGEFYPHLKKLLDNFSHLARSDDGALVGKIDELLHKTITEGGETKKSLAEKIHNMISEATFTDSTGQKVNYKGGLPDLDKTYSWERTAQIFKDYGILVKNPKIQKAISTSLEQIGNDFYSNSISRVEKAAKEARINLSGNFTLPQKTKDLISKKIDVLEGLCFMAKQTLYAWNDAKVFGFGTIRDFTKNHAKDLKDDKNTIKLIDEAVGASQKDEENLSLVRESLKLIGNKDWWSEALQGKLRQLVFNGKIKPTTIIKGEK